MIACAHQLLQAGFCQSQILKEHLSLILIQLGDLLLDLRTDHKYLAVLFGSVFTYCLYILIVRPIICDIILCNVSRIDHRFCSKKIIGCKPCILIFVLCFQSNGKLSFFQMRLYFFKECKLFGSFLIHTCSLGNLGNSSLEDLKIRENKLQINSLDIAERINASIYMNNIGILKAAYHVNDSIYLTDICKELVSKSLSLRCAFYKTCNIDEFDHCRCYFF